MLLVGAANRVSARLGSWGNRTGGHHTSANQAGQNLAGVALPGADISETHVSEVSPEHADSMHANLAGIDFTQASVDDGLLDAAMWTPGTIFREAILNGVDLFNLDVSASGGSSAGSLTATGFQHANLLSLHLAGFDGLTFDGAGVSHATLQFAGLASGQNANFTGTALQDAWSNATNVTNAAVQLPQMDEGDFSTANVTNADVQFAALLQASLDRAVFTGAQLDDAALSGDSTGTDFAGASIYGATLEPYNDYTRPDLTAAISTPIVHNPEPGTLFLLGTGLAGLLGYGWRRQRQVA
jgi:uncharacterized protein YjbI with pentapeptide repeats